MDTFKEWWENDQAIKMNIPLFIRILEYVMEDIKTDIDLHKLVERIINVSHGDNGDRRDSSARNSKSRSALSWPIVPPREKNSSRGWRL